VTDTVGDIVEPLQRLFNCKYLIIWNGKELDTMSKHIHEIGFRDNDKLLLVGVPSADQESSVTKSYKRFRDFKVSDYWYVGRDRWDAIMFIPNKPIRVMGFGIFEVHPSGGPFAMGYKYVI